MKHLNDVVLLSSPHGYSNKPSDYWTRETRCPMLHTHYRLNPIPCVRRLLPGNSTSLKKKADKQPPLPDVPTREFTSETKSGRSQEDGQAEMGMGATNTLERVAASLGLLEGITPAFQTALDIPRGGVLFALPALLARGLLKFSETYFSLPRG